MIIRGIPPESKVGMNYATTVSQQPPMSAAPVSSGPQAVENVVEEALAKASEPSSSEPAPLTAAEQHAPLEKNPAELAITTSETGPVGMGPFTVTVDGTDGLTVSRKGGGSDKRAGQVLITIPDAGGKALTCLLSYTDANTEQTLVLDQGAGRVEGTAESLPTAETVQAEAAKDDGVTP